MRRAAIVLAALLALAGCTGDDEPAPAPPATATGNPDDLPPGYDEPPDGEIVPDSALTPAEVTALLRLPATDPSTADTCTPADLSASIDGFDAAAGHRYARLLLTNTSDRTCTLSGYPGVGARGEWGNRFELTAEQRDPLDGAAPQQVTLQPGAAASANLEWTGELAGAESEKASLLAVQLAQGQDAFGVPVGDEDLVDIGILTTVRVGPFRTVAP
jgi:hypothetical protein